MEYGQFVLLISQRSPSYLKFQNRKCFRRVSISFFGEILEVSILILKLVTYPKEHTHLSSSVSHVPRSRHFEIKPEMVILHKFVDVTCVSQ